MVIQLYVCVVFGVGCRLYVLCTCRNGRTDDWPKICELLYDSVCRLRLCMYIMQCNGRDLSELILCVFSSSPCSFGNVIITMEYIAIALLQGLSRNKNLLFSVLFLDVLVRVSVLLIPSVFFWKYCQTILSYLCFIQHSIILVGEQLNIMTFQIMFLLHFL